MHKIEKIISENWNTLKFITLIISIFGAFITFDNYINNQITAKITESTYLSTLSKSLRPFLIFNEDGIIIYDHGAVDLIEKIDVDQKNDIIIVHFNKFLQNSPLLIVIGASHTSYRAERGKDYTWVYKLASYNIFVDGSNREIEKNKYVLEILM